MRNFIWTAFIACCISTAMHGQVLSHFEFNGVPLTTATTGPNATSIDPDAGLQGGAAHITNNCNSSKGLDLTIPVGSGIFDVPSLCIAAIFQRDESIADFFVRGNTRFWIDGGEIRVQYMTVVGGIPTMNGPFLSGHIIPNDNTFRTYTMCYDHITGLLTISVDGVTVFSHDGTDNAPLHWLPTDPIIVGKNMDGNCNGRGVLDDFMLYVPAPLPITLSHSDAFRQGGSVVVEWSTSTETGSDYFSIERSEDGIVFTEAGRVIAAGNSTDTKHYSFTDPNAGNSILYYRIHLVDASGLHAYSRVMEVTEDDAGEIISAYPNPTMDGIINLNFSGATGVGTLRIIDISGKELSVMQVETSGIQQIDLNGYGKGFYFIDFRNESTRKVVKVFYQYSSTGKRVKSPR